jgi:hypothetical protein
LRSLLLLLLEMPIVVSPLFGGIKKCPKINVSQKSAAGKKIVRARPDVWPLSPSRDQFLHAKARLLRD